jgi:quinol monooxygenase YgiN
MAEVLSIAIFDPLPGSDDEALATMRALGALMAEKGYSRDRLYRDPDSGQHLLLRYWTSAAARREAHEDPQVHAFWIRLSELIQTRTVYEKLDDVSESANRHGV